MTTGWHVFAALAVALPLAAQQNVGSELHTFTGILVDAVKTGCGPETRGAAGPDRCPVSVATDQFGLIRADGHYVQFDPGGNGKAADALRHSKKGSRIVIDYWRTGKISTPVRASVTGYLTSDVLNVQSVRVE